MSGQGNAADHRDAPIERIAVIGAGTMGHALAMTFLDGGLAVALHDADASALKRAPQRVVEGLTEWRGATSAQEAASRLRTAPTLADAVAEADLVIEAIVEDLDAKQALFAQLDGLTSADAVLCTNTSALPIERVTARVAQAQRAIGTHWFNPPHLVPAVEVIPTTRTSERTRGRVMGMLAAIGKVPIQVPDVPGFVANRLQMALVKEAITCVAEGIASAADIDRVFTNSIGFRLATAGPLAIADFAGLDVYLKVFEALAAVEPRFAPPDELRRLVAAGALGVKTGAGFMTHDDADAERSQRDRRLLALAALSESPSWGGEVVE